MPDGLTTGADGRTRCWWCGDDPLYVAYHDDEWGHPVTDERDLFEKLLLDGAQAGLSWITILRKREGYQRAFEGFDPERIAAYGDADVARLLADAGIVRNRAKVASFIGNARALLALHEAGETPQRPRLVARTGSATADHGSQATSRPCRQRRRRCRRRCSARGFKFVGPTIVYAFMQATGVVDDHLAGCWRVSG